MFLFDIVEAQKNEIDSNNAFKKKLLPFQNF